MTTTTAFVYPTATHGSIIINLYQRGSEIYPSSAACSSLDNISLDYLRRNWPIEPGWYWDKDDCCHATVKEL